MRISSPTYYHYRGAAMLETQVATHQGSFGSASSPPVAYKALVEASASLLGGRWEYLAQKDKLMFL
jgi:hypothetical protein